MLQIIFDVLNYNCNHMKNIVVIIVTVQRENSVAVSSNGAAELLMISPHYTGIFNWISIKIFSKTYAFKSTFLI